MDTSAVQWLRSILFSQPPVPIFKRMVIGHDYVTYEWEPPKKRRLAFMPIDIPYIEEYRVDYKLPNNGGNWDHTICTGSKKITSVTFHKSVYPLATSCLDAADSTYNKHTFFIKDTDVYDIRVYGKNHAETSHNYLTHTSFSLHKTRKINKISGKIAEVPTSDFQQKYYIISKDLHDGPWKNMKNCVTTSFMNGWIFIYPDELEIMDGYLFKDGEWIDFKITPSETTDICSICLIQTDTVSHCGHHFHRDCINQIIGNKCPMCRVDLNKLN